MATADPWCYGPGCLTSSHQLRGAISAFVEDDELLGAVLKGDFRRSQQSEIDDAIWAGVAVSPEAYR